MITAVDTNVLLEVLVPGAPHGDDSEQTLTESLRAGATVVTEAVYAELAGRFPAREELEQFLEDTDIRLQPSGAEALHVAGRTWREYIRRRPTFLVCPSCGNVQDVRWARCGTGLHIRQHVVADFLIGAHATLHADRLLTRDRGYYQTYFSGLQLASRVLGGHGGQLLAVSRPFPVAEGSVFIGVVTRQGRWGTVVPNRLLSGDGNCSQLRGFGCLPAFQDEGARHGTGGAKASKPSSSPQV